MSGSLHCRYLKVFNRLLRSWDRDPATSTIQRVRLSELDFPAITVCPDYATDSLALRTVLNMIEFEDKVRKKQLEYKPIILSLIIKVRTKLPNTLKDMKEKLWMVPDTRDLSDYKDRKWITDFGGDDGERLADSVANVALRKTDLKSFAFFREGNLLNNLFYKVHIINFIKRRKKEEILIRLTNF